VSDEIEGEIEFSWGCTKAVSAITNGLSWGWTLAWDFYLLVCVMVERRIASHLGLAAVVDPDGAILLPLLEDRQAPWGCILGILNPSIP